MKLYKTANRQLSDGWILSSGEVIYCGTMEHEEMVEQNMYKFGITQEEWNEKVENYMTYNSGISDRLDAVYLIAFEKNAIRFSFIDEVMAFITGKIIDVKKHVDIIHRMCKNHSIRKIKFVEFKPSNDNNIGYYNRSDLMIEDLYRL